MAELTKVIPLVFHSLNAVVRVTPTHSPSELCGAQRPGGRE